MILIKDLEPARVLAVMLHEFATIIEQDEGWRIAFCPEVPGANGQGRTEEEARESLHEAINLFLEDRREDGGPGYPAPT